MPDVQSVHGKDANTSSGFSLDREACESSPYFWRRLSLPCTTVPPVGQGSPGKARGPDVQSVTQRWSDSYAWHATAREICSVSTRRDLRTRSLLEKPHCVIAECVQRSFSLGP